MPVLKCVFSMHTQFVDATEYLPKENGLQPLDTTPFLLKQLSKGLSQ